MRAELAAELWKERYALGEFWIKGCILPLNRTLYPDPRTGSACTLPCYSGCLMHQYYRLWPVHRDLVQHLFYWIINRRSFLSSSMNISRIPFDTVSRGKDQECWICNSAFCRLGYCVFWRDFLEPIEYCTGLCGGIFETSPILLPDSGLRASFISHVCPMCLEHSPIQDSVWTLIKCKA